MSNRVHGIFVIDMAGLSGLLTVSLGAYLMVARPMLKANHQSAEASRIVEQSQVQLKAAEDNLADARSRLDRIEAGLSSLNVRLLPVSNINRQLDDLSVLAEKHQLQLTQLAPGQSERGAWYTSVPIRMAGTGTFLTCVNFLNVIQDRYSDIAVRGIKMTTPESAKGTEAENRVVSTQDEAKAASFEFEFVWYAAPEGQASAEQPK